MSKEKRIARRAKGMTFPQFVKNMLTVGCIGFGGGSALIPVIENIFLRNGHLDVKENYDKDVVVASLTPGALPVEIASGLGRRNFGTKGMIAGSFCMALPGAIGTFLLLTLLTNAQDTITKGLKIAAIGISAFIIGMLLTYISRVIQGAKKQYQHQAIGHYLIIAIVAFMSCGSNLYKLFNIDRKPVFGISTIIILLAVFFIAFYTNAELTPVKVIVCTVLCVLFALEHGKKGLLNYPWLSAATAIAMIVLALYGFFKNYKPRKAKIKHNLDVKTMARDIIAWTIFFIVLSIPAFLLSRGVVLYLGRGIASAFLSFGGGDAYLTVADGMFVETGLLSSDAYYGEIVPIVNVLPGSILCKTLLGIGYYVGTSMTGTFAGGFCFALSGLACSISMSCISFMAVYYLYDGLAESKGFMLISQWIRPVISGLLINVMISLLRQGTNASSYLSIPTAAVMTFMVLLAVACYFLLKKLGSAKVLLIAIGSSVVFCAILLLM